jgi:PKD repeat protein
MKTNNQFLALLLLCCSFLFACSKTADTPYNNPFVSPPIGGTTTNYKDTVAVTIGTVTLKHSKTSACFPSNEIFAFDASASGLPSGAVFSWDFGDGHTLTGSNVRNIYDIAGSYTVIVTIKDAGGGVLSKTSVNVKALGQQVTPHAVFSSQIFDVNFVNNMAFTSQSSVRRGSISNYSWDWGDGTTTSTVNAFTPHNFPPVATDKIYPVRLVATANSGCKDTTVVPVSVGAVFAPTGDFSAISYDVCSKEYFIFTPTVTGIPPGCVFTWDFADATGFVTGSSIKKYFTYQNDYDVKLTVTFNGKNIYQTHKPIRAQGQNVRPIALFIKNVASDNATSVTWAFYSQSNIPHGYFTGYRWEFPSGRVDDNFNTYIEQKYTKTAVAQTQTIKFIVTGNSGCKDTATGTFIIPAL